MSTAATATSKQSPERVDEILGTMAAVGAGGALLAGLGKLFWGNTKNTPEQLAELRAMITTIRKYLAQVRGAYGKHPIFGDISKKLNAFNKQTEAAFASNNPRQIQRAVLQAGSVAAYLTRFALIQEDIRALATSHADELNSDDRGQHEKVFKMMQNIIFRELSAVNMNKLGGFFKRLTQLGFNFVPAPAGLTPKDLANSYMAAFKQEFYKGSEETEQQPNVATDQSTQAPAPAASPAMSPAGLVAEAHRALFVEVQQARLVSLNEYKRVFQRSLAEEVDRMPAVEKFLASSGQIVNDIAQANRAATTTANSAAAQPAAPGGAAAQQPGALTPEQAKRVQVMLQSVSSVLGRLTPDQKKQFSQLLGQLKTAIG